MIMSKGTLICFIGIDGSGKSTISREVYNFFLAKGSKTKYVYGRVVPFFFWGAYMGGQVIYIKEKKKKICT